MKRKRILISGLATSIIIILSINSTFASLGKFRNGKGNTEIVKSINDNFESILFDIKLELDDYSSLDKNYIIKGSNYEGKYKIKQNNKNTLKYKIFKTKYIKSQNNNSGNIGNNDLNQFIGKIDILRKNTSDNDNFIFTKKDYLSMLIALKQLAKEKLEEEEELKLIID